MGSWVRIFIEGVGMRAKLLGEVPLKRAVKTRNLV